MTTNKKSYLITGGAGFIGSNLVHELIKQGNNVRILDSFVTGRMDNLNGILDKIDLIVGDLNNRETVQASIENINGVFHQAAIPSVPRSLEIPMATHHANLTSTLTLLDVISKSANNKIPVVYAGSSSAYGDVPYDIKIETLAPEPRSPYATQKLAGEMYCKAYKHSWNIPIMILRYFNVFGPRQDPNSGYSAAIPSFIKKMLNGEQPIIYGNGTQSRDFVFVDDVVSANICAMGTLESNAWHREDVCNVARGQTTSLLNIVKTINKILEMNIKPEFKESRKGDVYRSLANVQRAYEIIGWRAKVDIPEGLRKTVDWIKENER